MTRDFLLILTVLSRGPAKFRVATTVYPLLPKHPCRSVPSTFEKHGISPSGIEWRPPHPARRPPRRPSQASSPSLFPSDEQINRWSPVGASSAPEPTDAFPSLQLHKGGSPTVSIPLRILDLVGFMGPSLLPISGWTRMAAGSRGCQWVPSHLANPDIGESACAIVLSRPAIRLATSPLAMSEPPNSAVPEPSTPSATRRLAANVSAPWTARCAECVPPTAPTQQSWPAGPHVGTVDSLEF